MQQRHGGHAREKAREARVHVAEVGSRIQSWQVSPKGHHLGQLCSLLRRWLLLLLLLLVVAEADGEERVKTV